jgi:hypothetical protein
MKFGNLNFPEPSGPRQACNGIALPLPFTEKSNLMKIRLVGAELLHAQFCERA